ncbi:MAG: tetratricopeptide repeat protein [Pricia sp.]
MGFLTIPMTSHAQENSIPDIDVEESAEVFLEAYSDEFQEVFFEALKQKGIENYDKAINLLLKCKQLDESNRVVDHELAKVYLQSRQYPLAEEYALTALNAEPGNLWYADTLVGILQKQGKSVENIEADLPFGNPEFNENIARIHFKNGNYETALALLKQAKQNSATAALTSKINASIEKRKARLDSTRTAERKPRNASGDESGAASGNALNPSSESESGEASQAGPNELEVYKMRITALIRAQTYPTLQQKAEEALEIYPSQPDFYYALGHALNKRGKSSEAIEPLETALDYLIDDVSLANKIYQELADAHTALGDAVKANTYLRKIKSGF